MLHSTGVRFVGRCTLCVCALGKERVCVGVCGLHIRFGWRTALTVFRPQYPHSIPIFFTYRAHNTCCTCRFLLLLQVEIFRKRFGFGEDAVSEETLAKATADPAALAVLTGKVGGKTPTVGMPYTLKPAIAYAI